MRALVVLILLQAALALKGQVLINELQATRVEGSQGRGLQGDWVELYNAGERPVDLEGYLLVQGAASARIPAGVPIAPKGHVTILCDGPGDRGTIDLKLPRKGGTLLLVSPDGASVLDLFSWPPLPPGASIGRKGDGARTSAYFEAPTPGGANREGAYRILETPRLETTPEGCVLRAGADAAIHYTLDATEPTEGSPRYQGALALPRGSVLRARALAANGVPSPSLVHTQGLPEGGWALVLGPEDLAGPAGIADTTQGNQVRRGRQWQRQGWLQQGGHVLPVGVALAGSGTRSLPKHSFRLRVRDRFQAEGPISLPDSSTWRTVVLRADASPHAFLRNTFMEAVVRHTGNRVDVQPGEAVPLWLNGHYHGLYRAMPDKGKEWLRQRNGGVNVELAKKPGTMAGKAEKHYARAVNLLVAGVSAEQLERAIDLESLVDLACFDLWMGRPDHDLNARAWRPATAHGRWRWILYDMDMWAPPQESTLKRMCSSWVAEVPYVPQLLAQDELQHRVLARMAALCATVLSPQRATALLDSIVHQHRAALLRDHERWSSPMGNPDPVASYQALLAHIRQRNEQLLAQLADYTGNALHAVELEVEPRAAGRVLVEELELRPAEGPLMAFEGVPLQVRAVPREGMEFIGWSDSAAANASRSLVPTAPIRLRARFGPTGSSNRSGL